MNIVSENSTASASPKADKISSARRKDNTLGHLPATNSLPGAPLDEAALALMETAAQELADRAKWGAAARALLRVARAAPHNTERWLKIAQWQRQDQDVKAAARTLRTALRFHAGSAAVSEQAGASSALWLALAEIQLETQAWDECIAACHELLKVAPTHHLGQEILATALLYNGQVELAVDVMQGLLRLSPRDPLHRLKLATLLHLQGRLGDSLCEFQRVVTSHPDAPFTQEAYETIETLDKIQIQHILARASEDHAFRLGLQRTFDEAIDDSGFYLSDGGRESLRHLLWDGRLDDNTIIQPAIH